SIAFREKTGGVREIAAALRIAPDAMLFVDDNPGEIAAVAAELPGIRVLHAADPALAARALDLYPGLHGHPRGRDDSLRVADPPAPEPPRPRRAARRRGAGGAEPGGVPPVAGSRPDLLHQPRRPPDAHGGTLEQDK